MRIENLEYRQLLAGDAAEKNVLFENTDKTTGDNLLQQEAAAGFLYHFQSFIGNVAYEVSGLSFLDDIATHLHAYPLSTLFITSALATSIARGENHLPFVSTALKFMPHGILRDALGGVVNSNLLVSSLWSAYQGAVVPTAGIDSPVDQATAVVNKFNQDVASGIDAAVSRGINKAAIASADAGSGLGKICITSFTANSKQQELTHLFEAKIAALTQQGHSVDKAIDSIGQHVKGLNNGLGKTHKSTLNGAWSNAKQKAEGYQQALDTLAEAHTPSAEPSTGSGMLNEGAHLVERVGETLGYIYLAHNIWRLMAMTEGYVYDSIWGFIDNQAALFDETVSLLAAAVDSHIQSSSEKIKEVEDMAARLKTNFDIISASSPVCKSMIEGNEIVLNSIVDNAKDIVTKTSHELHIHINDTNDSITQLPSMIQKLYKAYYLSNITHIRKRYTETLVGLDETINKLRKLPSDLAYACNFDERNLISEDTVRILKDPTSNRVVLM